MIQLLSFFFFQNQTYSKAIQWILELHYGVKTLRILSVEEKIKQWGNKHIVLLINFSWYSDPIFNRDLGGENQGILQNLIRLYCARILQICNIHCSSPCSCLQYTGVCDLFFFCFFHSFIGCSSSDIQYKFVIQHTHTHTQKQKNNSLALRMVLKGTSTTSSLHYRFSSSLNWLRVTLSVFQLIL